MATTSNTRTLRAYVTELLELPRWIIEREVDFTDCPLHGYYNENLPGCVNCQFGKGCRWLDQDKFPNTGDAPLDELIEALESSVDYLQSTKRESETGEVDVKSWVREARRFLQSKRA